MGAPKPVDGTFAVLPVDWAVDWAIQEALEPVLAPRVRAAVLERAGWNPEEGRPVDASLELERWIDAKLFPELVTHMSLTAADELRRQLHVLLSRVTATGRRPEVLESGCGPAYQLEGETLMPSNGGQTVIAWLDAAAAEELKTRLPDDTFVVVVKNAIELTLTLAVAEAGVSVVLLDRREPEADLERVLEHHLARQSVLVWGTESIATPEWQPLLSRAGRAVSCGREAELGDVASLCTQLLAAV